MEISDYSDALLADAMRRVLRGEESAEATLALKAEAGSGPVVQVTDLTLARAACRLHKEGDPDAQMALEEVIEDERDHSFLNPRQMELQED